MPGAAIDTLRRVPLFAELDAAELQSVADSMRERVFAAGDTVTVEGEAGDGFFVVDSGEAEVVAQGQPVGIVGAGDYVGEIALLMGADRTATITATTELRCYVLAPLDFRTLVEGNPTIAWKLLQSLQSTLA